MNRIILLIQDDADDADRIRQALTHSSDAPFQVEWCRRCSDGLERLAAEGPGASDRIEAVLLDLFVADSSGLDTFERFFLAAPHLPILVLAAERDEAVARLAVHRGAQDFLLKSRIDGYTLPKILGSMIERATIAESLFKETERAQVTLDSIGDAVLCTDVAGRVTYLNRAAEHMTGCSLQDSEGLPLEDLFRLVNSASNVPVENPLIKAMRENAVVGLTPNCLLVRRDRVQMAIEDSAAPIHDRQGHVIGAVMVFHDVTAARTLMLRMAHQAQHDGLTDLPNRSVLKDRLEQAIARAQRNTHKLAVLFLDLDRFKNINDTLGHDVGDRLLQSVAQRLISCVRATDTVSRQGGDEFVILVAEVTLIADAIVFANKVVDSLAAPHTIDAHHLHITTSIGIAIFPDDGLDAETLMKNADLAMYVAKDRGRDSFQFFMPEMDGLAIERQSIESDLRHAIERGEMELHYQPVVNLATRAIVGAEALIRWNHPGRGLVPASHFIPIAEERGLIAPIGRWVLRMACQQAQAWREAGLPPLCMGINISTANLRDAGFADEVFDALAAAGVAPCDLEIELTETLLMQDPANSSVVLKALGRWGVRIALDDFGTGYSSLSYLKRFPIGTLKVDQSFVRDAATDSEDAGIVTAVIGLGRSLKLGVVAEGVETAAALAFLVGQGCPTAQGHFFSPAIPAAEFSILLERGLGHLAWPSASNCAAHRVRDEGAGRSPPRPAAAVPDQLLVSTGPDARGR